MNTIANKNSEIDDEMFKIDYWSTQMSKAHNEKENAGSAVIFTVWDQKKGK